jgi:hypothetical protein
VVVVAASSWVYVSVCTDGGGRRTEDGRTGESHKEIESLNKSKTNFVSICLILIRSIPSPHLVRYPTGPDSTLLLNYLLLIY